MAAQACSSYLKNGRGVFHASLASVWESIVPVLIKNLDGPDHVEALSAHVMNLREGVLPALPAIIPLFTIWSTIEAVETVEGITVPATYHERAATYDPEREVVLILIGADKTTSIITFAESPLPPAAHQVARYVA